MLNLDFSDVFYTFLRLDPRLLSVGEVTATGYGFYYCLSSDYKKSHFNLLSYKAGLQSVEEILVHYKKNEAVFTEKINILNLEVKLRDNALVEYIKNLEKSEKEKDELKLILEKLQNSSKSINNLLESQVSDKVKTRLGYNAASPAVESSVKSSEMLENQENVESRLNKGYHAVPLPFTGNYMPPKCDLRLIDEHFKSVFEHLQYECDQRVVKPVWNNTRRVNHKNFANKFTHPHPKRRFVPQIVLTRTGKINTAGASVTNVVRPVNTAGSKSNVNHPRLILNAFKSGHSQAIRPFNKYSAYKKTIFKKEVNVVNAQDVGFGDSSKMLQTMSPNKAVHH
nr:retrotransposon Orf1 [Tanacetum cinerariifolium]